MKQSRRNFLQYTGMAIGAMSTSGVFPQILRNRHPGIAPSDQVNLGLIGCHSRGFHVMANHLKVPGVNCVAVCDIDRKVLEGRAAELEGIQGAAPKLHEDFRALIAQSDIDAVVIATPDHWHCLPMVYACQAGKDVYVEKPMANSIAECLIMVEAARKYQRIVQVGQQQRSSTVWQQAINYVKSGRLGAIHKVNVWGNFNYGLGPMVMPDGVPPEGVNYDLFLGPAPVRPFNAARFHGSWRFFWDYGGGLMTDWGVHLIDMAMWAKGLVTPADRVVAEGAKMNLHDRSTETFEITSASFKYDDFTIQWEHHAGRQVGPYDRHYGVAFIGENGTLVSDRRSWEVLPEYDQQTKKNKLDGVSPVEGKNGHMEHTANFISCIKSREEPACTVEMGAAVAINAHMANIALRSNSFVLEWDRQKNQFIGNRKANKLITPSYRKPWSLPKIN